MKGNHPKRRKDKYNPYSIFELDGKYYIEFTDGQRKEHRMEISRKLYEAFDSFELDDLKHLNIGRLPWRNCILPYPRYRKSRNAD